MHRGFMTRLRAGGLPAALLAWLFLLAHLVPAGWMPMAQAGDTGLVLCTDAGLVILAAQKTDQTGEKADERCAWAAGAQTALTGAVAPALIAMAWVPAQVSAFAGTGFVSPAPAILPPNRAPPQAF